MNLFSSLHLSPDVATRPEGAIPDGNLTGDTSPDLEFDREVGITSPPDTTDDLSPELSSPPAPAASEASRHLIAGDSSNPADKSNLASSGGAPALDKDGKPLTGAAAASAAAAAEEFPTTTRDYSKFPEDLQGLVKKLPNRLFANAEKELAPVIEKLREYANVTKERDELRTQVAARPNFAHDHPDGYVLDQEFQQVSAAADRCSEEAAFYETQLAAVMAGEPWIELLGYDKTTGRPVTQNHPATENGQPNIQAQIALQSKLHRVTANGAQLNVSRNQFKSNYANRVNDEKRQVTDLETKIFPKLDLTSIPDKERKVLEIVRAALPRSQRNNVLVPMLEKAYIMCQRFAAHAAEKDRQLAGTSALATAQRRAGPRIAATGSQPETSDTKVWTPAMLEKDV